MAVGDLINRLQDVAAGTPFVFQPAAGVEIIVIGYGTEATANAMFMGNGTIIAAYMSAVAAQGSAGIKMCLTNTNFLELTSGVGTTSVSFSGVQTT